MPGCIGCGNAPPSTRRSPGFEPCGTSETSKRTPEMKLDLPQESVPVQQTFERFFATEATAARVRAAEPLGFDPGLWRSLVQLGVPAMRVSADAGGGGMSLFDTALIMEEAGRRLA